MGTICFIDSDMMEISKLLAKSKGILANRPEFPAIGGCLY
jgi:hypothetical protein